MKFLWNYWIALVAVLVFLLFTGCTSKITNLEVKFDGKTGVGLGGESKSGGEIVPGTAKVNNVFVFWAPGASVKTQTDQATDAQIPISAYGANSATGKQVNPQGTFEVVNRVSEVVDAVDLIDPGEAKTDWLEEEVKKDPPPPDPEPPAAKIATLPTTAEEKAQYGYDTKTVLLYAGERMSYDDVWQDKFVFPKLAPEYGKTILVVWSDGNELAVPDSSHMAMLSKPDARKFQPGGKYSGNNPKIPTMEVYAQRYTHPKFVTIYYNSKG